MIIKFKIQLLFFYTIFIFVNIEEIKNSLREFQAENGWKIKNTHAGFKKVVSYIKKSVFPTLTKSSLKVRDCVDASTACRYEEFHAFSNTEEVIFEGERLCVDASTACRNEDFYATSNTEEVIIDDERLCVDARTACRYEDFYATSNS